MNNLTTGLHHITAIVGNAQRNYDFYTQALGLRFVKKTVNFDDPGTYHFYYGNYAAEPGTILTFFPWANIRQGRAGIGQATSIGYSVPEGAFGFWKERFDALGIRSLSPTERFGEPVLGFWDPDGLLLELTIPSISDSRLAHVTNEVPAEAALKGFHQTTLSLQNIAPTARILTELLGYEPVITEGKYHRFVNPLATAGGIVDLLEEDGGRKGLNAAGTIHHVAFRVPDDTAEQALLEKIRSAGLQVTDPIDRNYFHSLYFREPGGVLFEIATDMPGFMVDEPLDSLGESLKLPPQYEAYREQILAVLPNLHQ
ncbi:MAG: ring-cleaving dioxygenase [Bacteroidetes Order II. Incertae sedis bacterium]|nr:ring-cleaving dioxygenase [Bacteroidetes Order II. bacterium]